jgi:O-antigen/teichoic acid export membrane protein
VPQRAKTPTGLGKVFMTAPDYDRNAEVKPEPALSEKREVGMKGRKLAFGALTSVVANTIKSILLFLLVPFMARLIGPEQYGLYSVVLPAVMLASAISDAGLGMSLSREKDDDSPVWSSSFYILGGLVFILSLLLAAYSYVLASSLGDDRIFHVSVTLSASLFFTGMAIAPAARLVRDGDLTTIAAIEFLCFISGAVAGVTAAWLGFGVWALVGQAIVTSGARALSFNLCRPTRLRWVFSIDALKPHFALGGAVGAGRLSDFAGRMLESLVITKFGSTALTGAFGFGNQVTKFAIDVVNNTTWSVTYIRSLHERDEGLKQSYFQMTRVSAAALFAIGGLVAAASDRLIPLLMGPGWEPAVMLIAILAPALALGGVMSTGMSLMFGQGIARDPLILILELILLRVAAVLTFTIFGWDFMAGALGAAYVINATHGFWTVSRRFGWSISSILDQVWRPICAMTLAGAAMRWMLAATPATLPSLVACGIASAIIYLLVLFLMDRKRLLKDIREFYALLRNRHRADNP